MKYKPQTKDELIDLIEKKTKLMEMIPDSLPSDIKKMYDNAHS